MKVNFDYENIDFDSMTEEQRTWLFILLIFSFATDKDKEKLERIKNVLEAKLNNDSGESD